MVSTAVTARPVPLLQQVLFHLIAKQRAMLVFDATDLWVLHLLEIELDQLLRERSHRGQFPEPPYPGRDIRHSAFEGRRKPAIATFSIRKTWLPVPRLALSAVPANGSPLNQRLLD